MARIYPEKITVGVEPDLERWRDFAALIEKHAAAFRADLEKTMAVQAQDGSGEGEQM
jgi:hypothetical protein